MCVCVCVWLGVCVWVSSTESTNIPSKYQINCKWNKMISLSSKLVFLLLGVKFHPLELLQFLQYNT